ncbi:TPR-domain-containing protein [Aspergillus terreus]|uniref:TPR-domain-containing protein n=1 Tax=Aspergillus terreus TaxID=33178 RepID=A0A5M3YZW0_ASPTE|nr:hypothetical protein ATETN484_0006003500 [Aspergillus terreus]GFF19776.1 TPR-domain-containing protein [Aspergillus terreus]
MDDVNHAVDIAKAALQATPPYHSSTLRRIGTLAAALAERFRRTHAVDDIDQAVDLTSFSLAFTDPHHINYALSLNNLAVYLLARFEQTCRLEDINRAIEICQALESTSTGASHQRGLSLQTLSCCLARRFEQTRQAQDLDWAIDAAREAVSLTASESAEALSNLGNLYFTRYEQTSSMPDLNSALTVHAEVIFLMFEDQGVADHDRQTRLISNASRPFCSLLERQGGSFQLLNGIIEISEVSLSTMPLGHPSRYVMLQTLAKLLRVRFSRTDRLDDLHRGVALAKESASLLPADHPDRPISLDHLGGWLATRFFRVGAAEDLDRSVELLETAASTTPTGSPRQGEILATLSAVFRSEFERTGNEEKLEGAIRAADEAISATPPTHIMRPARLIQLANNYLTRFRRTNDPTDLDRALGAANTAVSIATHDHPDRAQATYTVAISLKAQFQMTQELDSLDHAIDICERTLVHIAPDDHMRATVFNLLGMLLQSKMGVLGDEFREGNELLLRYLKKGWGCRDSPPSLRIEIGAKLAASLASQLSWAEAATILQEAVELLPRVSPRPLSDDDKQQMLRQFAGLASAAAAVTLNAKRDADHALRLLELGRGVINGLLVEIRSDISDLRKAHSHLAQDFEYLRGVLDSSGDQKKNYDQRRELNVKFDELIQVIRSQPGFEGFLKPLTVDEMKTAADRGPIIVVNVSRYRCDAFLVEPSQIRVLELPKLSFEELHTRAGQLKTDHLPALAWLWDTVANPVLDFLGYKHPPPPGVEWPQVWWIPTGAMGLLPLHAAGIHDKGSGETVLDRVISSYNTSLKSLLYTRRQDLPIASGKSNQALLLAMPETPRQSPLPFANEEITLLRGLCQPLHLQPVEPPQCRNEVLQRLKTCKIFHFAGHGQYNPSEPSKSALLLSDWESNPLTVADLRSSRLQDASPFLAYLSACSTGANRAVDLVDESIHLVSSCQLAGFRHVIGTLWEVSDKHCVDVARILYQTIRDQGMTDASISLGLHQALLELRDRDEALGHIVDREPVPSSLCSKGRDAIPLGKNGRKKAEGTSWLNWVPYIHFGV